MLKQDNAGTFNDLVHTVDLWVGIVIRKFIRLVCHAGSREAAITMLDQASPNLEHAQKVDGLRHPRLHGLMSKALGLVTSASLLGQMAKSPTAHGRSRYILCGGSFTIHSSWVGLNIMDNYTRERTSRS